METDNPDFLEFSNDTKEETFEVSIDDSNIENTEKNNKVRRKSSRRYMCSQCSKGFHQVSNLTQHVEHAHRKKNQICPICGRGLSKAYIQR